MVQFKLIQLLVKDVDIGRISKILGEHRLKSTITCSKIVIEEDEIPLYVLDKIFANATIVGAQNYQQEDADTSDLVETKSEKDDESTSTTVEESESIHESETNDGGDSNTEIPHENDGISNENSTETGSDEVSEPIEDVPLKELNNIMELEDEAIDSEYYLRKTDDNLENIGAESEEKSFKRKSKVPKSKLVYRGEVYQWGTIRRDADGEGRIKECVIIIQNDYMNSASEDTIALFCTSSYAERAPITF